ncbi:MAG: transcription termination factor NusA [Limisphaerales bacterium]
MAKRVMEKNRENQSVNIAEALSEVVKGRNVEADYVRETLEAGLLSAVKKKYGQADNVTVKVDPKTGRILMSARRRVVEEMADPGTEITMEELSERGLKGKLGDEVEVPIDISEFGRNAIGLVKQVLVQKVREAERERVYAEYIGRVAEVVVGSVQQMDKGNVIVNLGRAEGVVPPKEQIPREKYRLGERLRCLVLDVQKAAKGPPVILSRAHPDLLRRLFELEVPEIFERIIEIKSVAREPGERSKIAVSSADERIDPVGACVGIRGIRVQSIVRELAGERIDVIAWSANPEVYVTRALAPAKVFHITANETENEMIVVVADDQLSLAIGKQGQNARLAAKLTGWKINVLAESEHEAERKRRQKERVPLFSLEGLSDAMAKKLMEMGYETVQLLAAANPDDLLEIEGVGPKKAEKLIASAKDFMEELKKRPAEEESEEEEEEELDAESEEIEEEEKDEEEEKEKKEGKEETTDSGQEKTGEQEEK